jgi:ATP-dependent DNA helicase DinG
MDREKHAAATARLRELYQKVQRSWPGFVARAGQIQTMQAVLATLLKAREADQPADGSNIAAIEAPTGTGKTLGYLLPAFVASTVLGKRVVISTATVALQEQLHHQDLPRLAKIVGPEMSYDIIKGRQRYMCSLKLDRSLGMPDDDDDDHDSPIPPVTNDCVDQLRNAYRDGHWNGDRDTWHEVIDDATWRTIEAHRSSCLRSRCSHYRQCAFYNARRQAAEAKIVVANHALVLSTLTQERSLLKPGQALWIFDEGHHLPDVGVEAFATRVDLDRFIKACNKASGVLLKAATIIGPPLKGQAEQHRLALRSAVRTLERIRDELGETPIDGSNGVIRFAHGVLPTAWQPLVHELHPGLDAASKFGILVLQELSARGGEGGDSKGVADKASMELGPLVRQLVDGSELLRLWSTTGTVPMAKWLQRNERSGGIVLCASPLTGAKGLAEHVWSQVAAAVVTSATLTACGEFTMFSRLAGLSRFPDHQQVVVQSPFNYAEQARLFIPQMRASPKQSSAFTTELQGLLPDILRQFAAGQLVLFASRRMLETVYQSMPPDLAPNILVQGQRPRQALLAEHRARVEAGHPSILFGLQSFGEGLDLPGKLCEHVVIEKIPFAPPDSPVDQALAEWLESEQRNPFAELTVPRAGVKLAQWVGRGIRTTSDRAVITICDTRLQSQAYGQRLLRGLPEIPLTRSVQRPFA